MTDPISAFAIVTQLAPVVRACFVAAVEIKRAFDLARENATTVDRLLETYTSFKELVNEQATYTEQATQVWKQTLEKIKEHCHSANEKLSKIEADVSKPRWRQLLRATPIALQLEEILQDAKRVEASLFLLDGFGSLGVRLSGVEKSLRELASVHIQPQSTDQAMEDKLNLLVSRMNHFMDRMVAHSKMFSQFSDVKRLMELSLVVDQNGQSSPTSEHTRHDDDLERSLNQIDLRAKDVRVDILSSKLTSEDKQAAIDILDGMITPWLLQWDAIEICMRDDFPLPQKLGRGSHSTVYKAKFQLNQNGEDCADKIDVAAKSLEERPDSNDIRSSFLTETNILYEANHPCIVNFYGGYWPKDGEGGWPQPLILMELMSGNLAKLRPSINENHVVHVLRDVAEGLEYLHYRGVIHMDLKPENVLVKLDESGSLYGRAKVSDFGVSRARRKTCAGGRTRGATVVGGTVEYSAPEILIYEGRARTSCDVWSFGALMCWLLDASAPSGSEGRSWMKDADIFRAAQDGILHEKWLKRITDVGVNDNLRGLAAECLSLRPEDRPSMQDVRLALDFHATGLERTWIAKVRGRSADVLFECGLAQYFGIECERNKSNAGLWLQIAADSGSKDAEYVLKAAFRREKGTLKACRDILVIARIHLEIEDQSGWSISTGRYFLALFYRWGRTVIEDRQESIKLLQESADDGNVSAQALLGIWYLRGECVKKDPVRAARLLREAAYGGNALAQRHVGSCFEDGIGLEMNHKLAFEFYKKAAQAGLSDAQGCLGSCYFRGVGVDRKYDLAAQMFQKAADGGDARALRNLGLCYKSGLGVEKNFKRAVQCFQKASDVGNIKALCNLGTCYATGGTDIEKNLELAFSCYRKAADANDAVGQNMVGDCYEKGIGVEQNLDSALEYYLRAAENGCKDAHSNVTRVCAMQEAASQGSAGGSVSKEASLAESAPQYSTPGPESPTSSSETPQRRRFFGRSK